MRPPNPAYGSGVFRRKLRLSVHAREAAVDLEDSNHGFRLRLRHDGEAIIDLQADPIRHPFVTCPGAVMPLRRLLGVRLDMGGAELRATRPGRAVHAPFRHGHAGSRSRA